MIIRLYLSAFRIYSPDYGSVKIHHKNVRNIVTRKYFILNAKKRAHQYFPETISKNRIHFSHK